MSEAVSTPQFTAVFPTPVVVTEEATEVDYAATTEFCSEIEPFGVYSVRVTKMPIEAFVGVGARQWVKTYGDQWPTQFGKFAPEVLHDETAFPTGGATRELVVRLDYDGPCSAFVRICAVVDGGEGRILVAAAIGDWSEEAEALAKTFLDSLHVVWSPAR